MRLKPLGRNVTELTLNDGTIVLFSYETPVAAWLDDNGPEHNLSPFIRTRKFWSKTTSKHINEWLDGRHADEVEQHVFDQLAKQH